MSLGQVAFLAPQLGVREGFCGDARLGKVSVPVRRHCARTPFRRITHVTAVAEVSRPAQRGLEYVETENGRTLQPNDGRYPAPPKSPAHQVAQKRIRTWDSVPGMWADMTANYGDLVCVVDEHNTNEPIKLTYRQVADLVGDFAAGLRSIGVSKSDVVAQFAENSSRWLLADQGLLSIGAINAVRGSTAPASELRYIYEASGSKALIVDNQKVLTKLLPELDLSLVDFIIILFGEVTDSVDDVTVYSFDDILTKGKLASDVDRKPCANRGDPATMLFTSGTSGKPKCVLLTHSNLLYQMEFVGTGLIEPLPGDTFVSILPCWHVFERTAEYYVLSRATTQVYSNIRHFKNDLATHKPEILIAVPRVLESLHGAVTQKVAQAPAARQKFFAFFTTISKTFIQLRRIAQGLSLEQKKFNPAVRLLCMIGMMLLAPLHALATKLVWSKIKEGFGGRARIAVIGGGATPMYLENFFEILGIEITVGYGLTETAPVIANRFHGENIRGSVGLPLPGTVLRIVDPETRKPVMKGEIGVVTVQGPGVCDGYFNDVASTRDCFSDDGYFNTGDLGRLLPQGHLEITGRFKDIIVLSNGENISPQPLEDTLRESPAIDQLMLVGQDQKSLGALIVPDLNHLHSRGFIDDATLGRIEKAGDVKVELGAIEADLKQDARLDAFWMNEMSERLRSMPGYQPFHRVTDYQLCLQPFTVENSMMTQTLKVKKHVVEEIYSSKIAEIYRRS